MAVPECTVFVVDPPTSERLALIVDGPLRGNLGWIDDAGDVTIIGRARRAFVEDLRGQVDFTNAAVLDGLLAHPGSLLPNA